MKPQGDGVPQDHAAGSVSNSITSTRFLRCQIDE